MAPAAPPPHPAGQRLQAGIFPNTGSSIRVTRYDRAVKSLAVAVAVGIAALYSMEAIRYFLDVLRWLPRHERWVRTAKGLCQGCGYDLTGNVSGTCPECGERVDRTVVDKASIVPSLITEKQPWWVWTVVAVMMILAVILQRWLWA